MRNPEITAAAKGKTMRGHLSSIVIGYSKFARDGEGGEVPEGQPLLPREIQDEARKLLASIDDSKTKTGHCVCMNRVWMWVQVLVHI